MQFGSTGRHLCPASESPRDRDGVPRTALYPHMGVAANIGYPLEVEGIDRATRRERVEDVAETLDVGELLDRETDELAAVNVSGSQSAGRSSVSEVFLMDEPLASLDAKLKVEMRDEIESLQRNWT